MIPARVSLITLGVQDMSTMREFYRNLGWREEGGSDNHSMFHTGGGVLALFPWDDLSADAGVPATDAHTGYRGFTLAINLETRELVDVETPPPARDIISRWSWMNFWSWM